MPGAQAVEAAVSAAVAEAPARSQEDAPAGAAMRAAAEAQQLRELEDKVCAGLCDQGVGFWCARCCTQLSSCSIMSSLPDTR